MDPTGPIGLALKIFELILRLRDRLRKRPREKGRRLNIGKDEVVVV